MEVLTLLGWSCVAVVVLLGFAPVTRGRGGAVNTARLDRLEAAAGLPLTDDLLTPVLARIGHRERWALWGGTIGIIVGVLLTVAFRSSSPGGILIMLGVALGGAIGCALATMRAAYRLSRNAPRLARVHRTTLADYVSPAHLAAARGMLVLAVAASIVGVALGGNGHPHALPLVFGACLAVAVPFSIVTEIVARQIVNLPQQATTDLELAWDDALRADALHQLLLNQILVCGFAAFAAPVAAGLFDGSQTSGDAATMAGVVVAATVSALITVSAGGWRRRPLERLWPSRSFHIADPAAGRV